MEKPPAYSPSESPQEQEDLPHPYPSYQQPPPENPDHPLNQEAGDQPRRNYGGTGYTHQVQGHPLQGQEYYPQEQRYPPQDPRYQSQTQQHQPQGQQYVGYTNTSFVSNSPSASLIQNQQQFGTGARPIVDTNMCLSIVSCFFFLPVGIFAVFKSSQTQNLYMIGDYAGAVASARMAKNLAIVAFVFGFIGFSSGIVLLGILAGDATDADRHRYDNNLV